VGDAFVARNNEKIVARADLHVSDVRNVGLIVERKEPPRRHAAIVGWPVDKSGRMSLAQQLAAVAQLELRT
jgi:hypothetical protein